MACQLKRSGASSPACYARQGLLRRRKLSLDIYLVDDLCPHCARGTESFAANITHNLVPMWSEAGVYEALYESGGRLARDILPALRSGLESMEADPPRFRLLDSPNGWGLYENAVPWLRRLVAACEDHPNAKVRVWR